MSQENLISWIKTDSKGYITGLTASRVSFTAMGRDVISQIQKDFGAGFFNGDWIPIEFYNQSDAIALFGVGEFFMTQLEEDFNSASIGGRPIYYIQVLKDVSFYRINLARINPSLASTNFISSLGINYRHVWRRTGTIMFLDIYIGATLQTTLSLGSSPVNDMRYLGIGNVANGNASQAYTGFYEKIDAGAIAIKLQRSKQALPLATKRGFSLTGSTKTNKFTKGGFI